MGFDRKRTYFSDTKDRTVAAGSEILVEGRVLVGSIENGVEVASYSAGGSASENVIGWSVNTGVLDSQKVIIETVTVPNTGATTETFTLSHGNLVSSSLRLYNNTDAGALSAGSPGSGNSNYSVTNSSGVVIVGSSVAGDSVTATYRYSLTVMEQQALNHSRPINQGGTTFFGLVAVGRGNGEIFTEQFDTSLDYSSATSAYALASGRVGGTAGSNTLLGRIVSRPSATDPYIGIAFNFA